MSSVVALSNTSGTIVETYSRACPGMFLAGDAFGNTTVCEDDGTPRSPNASLYSNPYMYTARRYDSETSLYYYRARIYSPTLGRFLQPDPIGYADGMNMYAYCGNNPINWIDPWGLEGKEEGIGGEEDDFGIGNDVYCMPGRNPRLPPQHYNPPKTPGKYKPWAPEPLLPSGPSKPLEPKDLAPEPDVHPAYRVLELIEATPAILQHLLNIPLMILPIWLDPNYNPEDYYYQGC